MIEAIARFFNAGGNFMWVILAVLALATAVVAERLIFYFAICRRRGPVLAGGVIRLLGQRDYEGARGLLKGSSPLEVLMRTAVERFAGGLPVDEIEDGVQAAAINELPRFTRRLNYLSLFANIATLLGLIGTISGLQTSFSSLAAVEASKKAVMLAAGIAEALNTTAFGLITAVPSMIMYTVLHNKQQRLAKDLDQSMVLLMNHIKKNKA